MGTPLVDTFPPPDGVAQVPSPRRNVLLDGVPVAGLAAILVTVLMTVPPLEDIVPATTKLPVIIGVARVTEPLPIPFTVV